jgi:hypothetical protein
VRAAIAAEVRDAAALPAEERRRRIRALQVRPGAQGFLCRLGARGAGARPGQRRATPQSAAARRQLPALYPSPSHTPTHPPPATPAPLYPPAQLKFHPDKNPAALRELTTEVTKFINQALEQVDSGGGGGCRD